MHGLFIDLCSMIHSTTGYLEGALTYDTMYQFYQNEIYDWFFGEPIPAPLLEFLEENLDWSRRQSRNIDQHATSEARAFWRAIALTVSQLDGLVAGYNAHCPPEHRLSTAELLLLSAGVFQCKHIFMFICPELVTVTR